MSSVLYDVPGPRARRRALIGTVVGGLALVGLVVVVLARLNAKGQLDGEMWAVFLDPGVQRLLLNGLLNTIKAAAVSIVLALVLGALLGIGRLSERAWVRIPAIVVVEFFRAVPLLLLILFGYFAYGREMAWFGAALGAEPADAFAALIIGLVLYNGSVLAEIFRAGINAVPRGQAEAAYALGLRKTQVMALILVPQAVRIMLPAIVAQCVVALKDSALGFIISYEELLNAGKAIYRSPDDLELPRAPIIQTIVVVGGIYIALNMLLGWFAGWLQRRTSRAGKPVIAPTVLGSAITGADQSAGA
jgi:glutamate transport system permease protein